MDYKEVWVLKQNTEQREIRIRQKGNETTPQMKTPLEYHILCDATWKTSFLKHSRDSRLMKCFCVSLPWFYYQTLTWKERAVLGLDNSQPTSEF